MRISRYGSSANHGTSEIELPRLSVSYNVSEPGLSLRHSYVSDFATNATHNYTLEVTLEEFGRMLGEVGGALKGESRGVIVTALQPYLRELVDLSAACVAETKLPSKPR
jgi:hypothetical protein